MKQLRYYQQEAVDAVFAFFEKSPVPNASPLIVLPTGAGKSLVIGALVKELATRGATVALVTHRDKLVQQDLAAIKEFWPEAPAATYAASLGKRNVSQVTVCQLQSIARKPEMLGVVDVVLIDEAHLVPTTETTQYGRLFAALKAKNEDLRLVGLTATPYRQGQGLLTQGDGALFHSICYEAPIGRLVQEGYLSPLVSAPASLEVDTSKIATQLGDFAVKDLELACDVDTITQTVALDVAKQVQAGRKSVLLFGVTVKHAAALRNALLFAGVSCEVVTGEHTSEQREAIYRRFNARELTAIASCDLLTTGFDAPVVDLIALVRPTKSTSLHVQMLGRGTRLHPGKKDCALLDYGGNVARHGPLDRIKIKPKQEGKKGEVPKKCCTACGGENPTSVLLCIFCGAAFPEPERKANKEASFLPPLLAATGAEFLRHNPDGSPLAKAQVAFQQVSLHHSLKGNTSLKVTYFGADNKRIANEYWSFDDGGYHANQRRAWWQKVVGTEPPQTTAEAHTRRAELPCPVAVLLKEDGKYLKVTSRKEAKKEEAKKQEESAILADQLPPSWDAVSDLIDDIWGV